MNRPVRAADDDDDEGNDVGEHVLVPAVDNAWPMRVSCDADHVRRQICQLSQTEPVGSAAGSASSAQQQQQQPLSFYPRAFSYHVSDTGGGTDVHMYGRTLAGETVAARATGFVPYMFLRLGGSLPSRALIEAFVAQVDALLTVCGMQFPNGSMGRPVRNVLRKVAAVRPMVKWQCIEATALKCTGDDRGFNDGAGEHFLQLFLYAPSMVSAVRALLEHAERVAGKPCDEQLQLLYEKLIARRKDDGRTVAGDKRGRQTGGGGGGSEPTAKRRLAEAEEPGTRSLVAALDRLAASRQSQAPQDGGGGDDDNAVDPDAAPDPWNDPAIDIAFDNEPDADPVPASRANELDLRGQRVSAARRAFGELQGVAALLALGPGGGKSPEVYEADIDFVIRFTIDAGFCAEECVTFVGGDADRRPFCPAMGSGGNGCNDIAFAAPWHLFRRSDDADAQDAVPPQICVSLDCEMETGPNFAFPLPQHQRVLQICCVVFDPVADPQCRAAVRRAFVLGPNVALPVVGPAAAAAVGGGVWHADEVYVCDSEATLVAAFCRLVSRLQPDMLTGWNMENFDLAYLLERSAVLGTVADMASMCRLPGARLSVAERVFQSSAHGTHLYKEVSGEGLWVWDLFQAFKRNTAYKFRSYSLEFVSNKLLGDRKEDVSYTKINSMQQTSGGRFKLMRYCTKDALLPARLIGQEELLTEIVELARGTGVPVDGICRRGLQIRSKACLYREAFAPQPLRHLFYTRTEADRRREHGSYEGAYVIAPAVGYHDQPIVTLDFASLYPSIMVTKNTCIKTLLPGRALAERTERHRLQADRDVWPCERPVLAGAAGDQPAFVRASRQRGLLPRVVQKFLTLRKQAKGRMKVAKQQGNRRLAALMNKRQLILKLNANSMYGVTGAGTSFSYCPEIAATVTATGRDMLDDTARLVRTTFTRANGYPFDAEIVYGDTDSVFVKLAGITIQESARYGQEMADFVTAHFKRKYGDRSDNIIKLEYEKSFSKLILYAKKRYVGWKWLVDEEATAANGNGGAVLKRNAKPDASGMETERRDACLLVSNGVRDMLALLLSDELTGDEARDRVRRYIWDRVLMPLEAGTVPWHLLIQSKQFRKRPAEYRDKGQKPPLHIQLVERLERRRSDETAGATVYQPGDRIQYVVVEGQEPGQKTSECGETPDYAWQHRLPLSQQHYVENAVHGTFSRVLAPILMGSSFISLDENSRKRDIDSMYRNWLRNGGAAAKRQRTAAFAPPPPPSSSASSGRASSLFALAAGAVTKRCALCGAPGADAASGLCGSHTADERQRHDDGLRRERDELQRVRARLWLECRACVQGFTPDADEARAALLPPCTPDIESLELATPCGNNTCHVYWERRTSDRCCTGR